MSRPANPEEITAALVAECAAIRALLAQAVRDEVTIRHEIGTRVRNAKLKTGIYGDHAVEWLANELGLARGTLYRYAMVAENWSVEDVKALSLRVNRLGEPLTWSHLVALTRVAGPTSRRELADQCLAAAWTVRELTDEILAQAGGSGASSQETDATDSVRAALTEGITGASRFTILLGIFHEALETRLAEEGTDEELMGAAIKQFEEVHERVAMSLERMRQATRPSRLRVQVVPRGPVDRSTEDEEMEDAGEMTRPGQGR
jgi:hypothetical protein